MARCILTTGRCKVTLSRCIVTTWRCKFISRRCIDAMARCILTTGRCKLTLRRCILTTRHCKHTTWRCKCATWRCSCSLPACSRASGESVLTLPRTKRSARKIFSQCVIFVGIQPKATAQRPKNEIYQAKVSKKRSKNMALIGQMIALKRFTRRMRRVRLLKR